MERIAQCLFALNRLKVIGDEQDVFRLGYRLLFGQRDERNRRQACQREYAGGQSGKGTIGLATQNTLLNGKFVG
ncbi:MAG: hypothetical protein IPL03_02950 [Sterolibacteriaceae bacterium]|nr:hypothetical protein [Candidatus Methylophosphatis haderslevensis]